MEPEFPHTMFAKDGEIYELTGKRCFAIGGAYSVEYSIINAVERIANMAKKAVTTENRSNL